MLDGCPEGLHGLAREVAAAAVDDGHRQEEREVRRHLLDRCDRGLPVEGVEHGLDEEDVDAALDQGARGLGVAVAQLVEGDVAIRRVLDPRRQREGDVGRTEGARDEAVLECVRGLAREARPLQVHLVGQVLEAEVRLRNARRGEGVGGDDVRAGFEVLAVDLGHELGLREAQDVAVVAQRLGVVAEPMAAEVLVAEALVLEHDAHRSVEDHDPALEEPLEALAN